MFYTIFSVSGFILYLVCQVYICMYVLCITVYMLVLQLSMNNLSTTWKLLPNIMHYEVTAEL